MLVLGLPIADALAADTPFPVELLQEEARLTNHLSYEYNDYASDVALSGDRAVATQFKRADLFVRENGAWRYQESLGRPDFQVAPRVALQGDTLILGDPYTILDLGPIAFVDVGTAYVYVRGTGPGLNAWNITDKDSFAQSVSYSVDVPPALDALTRTNGWRYRLVARFLDDYSQSFSMVFLYGDGTTRYGVYLDFNAARELVAGLLGASPVERVLTTNRVGATDYHTHELAFDPITQMVTYSFDGAPVHTWAGQSQINDGIFWGWGSTAGQGSMNVHQAHFEILQTGQVLAGYDAGTEGNPTVAPDPVTQGWTMNGTPGANSPVGPQSPDPATVWQLQATLRPSDANGGELFGNDFAISGDTLVVGAYGDDDSGADTGSAYVFVRNGTNWTQQQKLVPSARAAADYFGYSVDINGDTIIVGAPHRDSRTLNTFPGRAFVFVRSGAVWTEQAMLTALDGAARDSFGGSVAVDGDRAAVGADYDAHGADLFAGSAYIFEQTGAAWVQRAKVTANPVDRGGQFGVTLDLHGDTLVVGAERTPAHYVFARAGATQWNQLDSRVYTDNADPGVSSVAMDGQRFMVGIIEFEGSGGVAYIYGPDYGNVSGLEEYASKLLLYPRAASAAIPFDPNQTAFRYKHLLYGEENGDVRARFEMMSNLYGQPERDLASFVEGELLKGLALNPGNALLGNLLLDIYYCRTEAEAILAKNLLAQAEVARFGPPLAPPASANGFIIDNEIPIHRQLLASNKVALEGYFALLADDLGVSGDPPLGLRLFRDLVPARALMAATYTNASGMSVPVTTNATLFSGYKDLVLLFDLLRNHGRSAEKLARLLISRNGSGDRVEAATVVTDAQRFLFLQGTLLKNIFPSLPPEGDPSALAEAIGGWSHSLNALATVQHALRGGANGLGFADDFLMYVQKFTGQTEHFDSYDAFRARLDPTSGSNPLRSAKQAHQDALDSYASYRGFADQLAAQFDNSSITYRDRLRDIVGVFPGDPTYGDDPTAHPGSELDQQYRSIEVARLRILRNRTEIDNLAAEVQIEINRAAAVSNTVIRYGSMQAEVTKQIGHIKAAQAAANALADAFSPEKLFTRGIVVGVLNAVGQAGAEEGIANLEAQKERLAAEEQAQIEGIESHARVKTLLLGMRTLAVDSQEAALLLTQELNRFAALYREKEDLEQKIAEQDASLATRYFADPVHRLAAQSDMVTANLAFVEAQKWIYFMVRALEYKWNTPVRNYPFGGRTWSAATIFKLRNATELEQMYQAMDSFESQIQLPKDDYFDWFSVRTDFLGYRRTNDLGQTLFYTDPVTGATVDALTAFRSRLSQLQDAQGNIVLNFSTVTEIPGGTFFRGARFNAQGQILSKGLFLDKIRWLKISLPGNHTLGRTQLTGELRYGGTAFIRNFDVGTFDPLRPDRLRDELTAYATRFWFFHAPSATWRFNDALSSPVTMQLSDDPRVPPSVQELDIFKERSVATTGWVLTIPTRDAGQPVLNLAELDDVELYFFHYAVTRP
jgi:hypothetical protein